MLSLIQPVPSRHFKAIMQNICNKLYRFHHGNMERWQTRWETVYTLHSTLAIYHVIVSNTCDVYKIGHSEMSVSVEKVANNTFKLQ